MVNNDGDAALSATFSALADPTRRAILARLSEGACTVKDLSGPFSISAPAITKHLRVLEEAGLISRGREAQTRPCVLDAAPLEGVARFIERYRRFWEGSLDQLGAYLKRVQAEAASGTRHQPDRRPRGKKRRALRSNRT